MSYRLYRHYSAENELLYIGVSSRIPQRNREHEKLSPWWYEIARIEIEPFPDRKSLLEAERLAIQAEQPRFNIQHNKVSVNKHSLEVAQNEITYRIVTLRPLYREDQVKDVLGLSGRVIKREIDEGRLGHIEMTLTSKTHRFVSGWQLLDWLEEMGAKP